MREQHPESVSRRRVSEKRYICGRCGQCCRDSNNLNRHTESCHKWEEVTIGFGSKKRVLTGSRRCVALKRATKRASGHGRTRERNSAPREEENSYTSCGRVFHTVRDYDGFGSTHWRGSWYVLERGKETTRSVFDVWKTTRGCSMLLPPSCV